MSKELLDRLESVTSRLERVARKLGGGGGDDDGETPEYVTAYDKFVSTEGAALISATEALKFPDDVVGPIRNSLNNIQSLIRRLPNSKKPSPQDLMAFLKPTSESISTSDNLRYRGKKKFKDHYTAAYEFVNQFQWVVQAPLPAKFAASQTDSIQFSGNRVRKNFKDENTKKWLQALIKAGTAQAAFVKEFFKTGLTWNPKGGDLSSSEETKSDSNNTNTSTTTKTTTKTTTSKTTAPTKQGDTGQLFSQLNRGNIGAKGFGLKKVSKNQQTHKNKSLRKTGVIKSKTQPKKKSRITGTPHMTKRGFRLLVENYDGGDLHQIEKADLKTNIYICKCDNATFQVKQKVKSVTVDDCHKSRIYVSDVVSTIELVNCRSVQVFCQGQTPSIAVDKSMSPTIILSRKAYENPPNIFTSNISAMNLQLPGKTDKDDNIELPIPEQFETKIDNKTGTITTHDVKHG